MYAFVEHFGRQAGQSRMIMMDHRDPQGLAMLDALIDAITVDANSDDEKLWAFRQAFEDTIVVPCDAFVVIGWTSPTGC